MILHIFKIIWNERRINAWLVLEYIIIFCVLWFCCDYLYTMLKSYYGPQGFDINHVYMIDMGKKPYDKGENNKEELDNYGLAMTFLERVKQYPDIESVALSNAAVPYTNQWMSGYKINSDFINQTLRQRYVSSGFFDVFKIPVDGHIFDWTDSSRKDDAIISPFRNNLFGYSYKNEGNPFPVHEVQTLHYDNDWDARKTTHKVIGRVEKMKDGYFLPYESNIIMPLKREDVNLQHNQITIRVKPEADKDFIERFSKDMREQLFIGSYYLSSITSIEDLRNQIDANWGARNKMNSAYAITLFLVVNIFLGILGSFWLRTQSRRTEIGLRIALGSSKRKVQEQIIIETLLLLSIACVIGTTICLNLSDPKIVFLLGIPAVDKESWGIGAEQSIINFAITFGFLALISVIAVWYPARQASEIQPAEALHGE